MSKSTISCEEIERIARASSLELTEQLKERLRGDLEKMDELFHSMDDIDVCSTKQTDFRVCEYDCLRVDAVEAVAPKQQGDCYTYSDSDTGYFTVPKVIN